MFGTGHDDATEEVSIGFTWCTGLVQLYLILSFSENKVHINLKSINKEFFRNNSKFKLDLKSGLVGIHHEKDKCEEGGPELEIGIVAIFALTYLVTWHD